MNNSGCVGFGSYRISGADPVHEQSLRMALESGCSLIDTSTNYMDGRSEILIGKVLNSCDKTPVVVSKGGYIQGSNIAVLRMLNEEGLALEGLVDISKDLKHSINPEFLDKQIELSLARLNMDCIDVYLLHNPEYYFEMSDASTDEYYARIEKALVYLETQVQSGRIKSYGISSNTFVLPPEEKNSTSFLRVMEIVKKNNLQNFFHIQFPLNLLERGALNDCGNGKNLIDNAREFGVKTMINRPLNGLDKKGGLVRLADYTQWIDVNVKATSSDLYALLFTELTESFELSIEDVRKQKGIMTFSKYYKSVDSADVLSMLFNQHLIPSLKFICNGSIPESVIDAIRNLYTAMDRDVCVRLSEKAKKVAEQFSAETGVELDKGKSIACAAVEYYLSCGIDYVLVGMRQPNYVEQLKYLF